MKTDLDVVAIGEAMIEFNQRPAPNDRLYFQGFGGDTSNAMIAVARQGGKAAYISCVGDDDFGRLYCDLWRKEGVDISAVSVNPAAPTGIYFVQHDQSGHRFSYLRRGSAASLMQPSNVPQSLIHRARYLHVSGISQAISENARETVACAIQLARAGGVKISYDPNLRPSLWSLAKAKATLLETLPLCDEFLPGLGDLQEMAGLSDPASVVTWAHHQGAKVVVLKMGDKGVLASDGHSVSEIPAFAINAVDATGAGDCFDGAYLARRSLGFSVFDSARWATAAAALSTSGYGAVDPLPTLQQVAEFIQAHDSKKPD